MPDYTTHGSKPRVCIIANWGAGVPPAYNVLAGETPAPRQQQLLLEFDSTPAPSSVETAKTFHRDRLSPSPAPPRVPECELVSEARAAELILQVARQRRGSIPQVQVAFKPFRATLYTYRVNPAGTAKVKFHLAFRRASESVFLQAAEMMFCRGRRGRRKVLKTEYDAFVRGIQAQEFELPGARRGRRLSSCGPGLHRSLEESFNRVNAAYFHSQLKQPELCWSPVRARRVLGSYHERMDRLIVSRVFDSPQIPLFVLDYLMYHELLHKFLGIGRRKDGSRCMHGSEFRKIEKRFRYFKEAQQFLKKI